jgi:hypothetical protein
VSSAIVGAITLAWRQRGEHLGQLQRIAVDRVDVEVPEQVGEHPLGDRPVLEHVGHAAGDAQVVLQHVHRAVGVAHEVAAADVRPHAVHRRDAHAVLAEVHRVGQQLPGEHAVAHDLLVAVEVTDEELQRLQPLDQALPDGRPLLGRDHARDHVEGPGAIDVGAVAVDGERDAHRPDGEIGCLLAGDQLVDAQLAEPGDEVRAGVARTTVVDQLVPAPRRRVAVPDRAGTARCLGARPVRGHGPAWCPARARAERANGERIVNKSRGLAARMA